MAEFAAHGANQEEKMAAEGYGHYLKLLDK